MPNDVSKNVREFAAYINSALLDDEVISELSMLDGLACCGLTLVEDKVGESSLAYINSIREAMERQERDARRRPPGSRAKSRRT